MIFLSKLFKRIAKSAQAKRTLLYWHVSDFAQAIAHFSALGAPLYRGPMDIAQSLKMCQVADPLLI